MNSTLDRIPTPGAEEHFRPGGSRRARPRLHPGETVLVALVAANLGFLPWAYGGVDPLSQLASAALALAGLAISLLPRSPGNGPRCAMWPRLLRFPVFWSGLILFGYAGIQAANPAFEYHLAGPDWWLTRCDYLHWLPAGMSARFEEMNSPRILTIWFSGWATACALWTGLTRRSSIIALLTLLTVNAFALAAFGFLERAGGSSSIYGIRPVPSGIFFATLVYKNHAAAFFNLMTAVAISLALYTVWRNRRQPQRRGPAILHLFFALTLTLAVGLTYSLSGIILLVVFLSVAMPATFVRFVRAFPSRTSLGPAMLTATVLLAVLGVLGGAIGYAQFKERVEIKISGEGQRSVRDRWLAARQGLAMFEDRWLLGWGAGCFRYGFTKYQRADPEITQRGATRFYWEHVHNDWLELLIELGVLGMLPIALTLAWWFRTIFRLRLWRHPAIYPLLVALGTLAVDATGDFPLQCPAVLVTSCALLPLVVRWGQTESRP